MSWFTNAMKDMAGRKGARKLKTSVTRKTEDGNVTLTVKGVCVTDADELADKAKELGVTVSGKGGSFQAAEGTQGGSLVDEDAYEFTTLVCDPDSFQDKEKGKKRGVKADTLEHSENGKPVA